MNKFYLIIFIACTLFHNSTFPMDDNNVPAATSFACQFPHDKNDKPETKKERQRARKISFNPSFVCVHQPNKSELSYFKRFVNGTEDVTFNLLTNLAGQFIVSNIVNGINLGISYLFPQSIEVESPKEIQRQLNINLLALQQEKLKQEIAAFKRTATLTDLRRERTDLKRKREDFERTQEIAGKENESLSIQQQYEMLKDLDQRYASLIEKTYDLTSRKELAKKRKLIVKRMTELTGIDTGNDEQEQLDLDPENSENNTRKKFESFLMDLENKNNKLESDLSKTINNKKIKSDTDLSELFASISDSSK